MEFVGWLAGSCGLEGTIADHNRTFDLTNVAGVCGLPNWELWIEEKIAAHSGAFNPTSMPRVSKDLDRSLWSGYVEAVGSVEDLGP